MKNLIYRLQGIFSVVLCLLVFSGCAPHPRGGTPQAAIDLTLSEQSAPAVKAAPALPTEVRSALVSALPDPIVVAEAEPEAYFDIAASKVSAREFFMSLVEGSPVNMVVHPEVDGEITVDFKHTTIEEVLQVVHNVYGYSYYKTGNTYQVMPAGLQTRTFHVNYLNLVRTGSSQTRISSGQVSQIEGTDSSSDTETTGSGTTSGSQIDTETSADFWTELDTAIKSLIGTDEGRKVIVQPQAGIVVVVAMPDELNTVDGYLRNIEKNIQRQVVIEAKVIEVRLADGFQTGINWSALGEAQSGKGILASQIGGGSVLDTGISSSKGSSIDLASGQLLAQSVDALAFGGVFSMALNFNDFQGFVEMLESQGDVQVLSSPRISTINNQKAVIKVGSDEFYVTDISSETSSGATTTNSNDITLTPFFSGIALDVTPQIDAQGQVTLHIHPTVSEVIDQNKVIDAFGTTQNIPLAYSTVRESDSVIRARSGQLVVIGGLMQEKTLKDEAGVPFLSKIPGLGALFRHTKASSSKSELVILLRPQVIGSPGDWQDSLDASRQRVEKIAPKFQQNWRHF